MSCVDTKHRESGSPTFDVDMFTGRAVARERWRVPGSQWIAFFSGLFPTTTIPGTSIITSLGGVWDLHPAYRVSNVTVTPYAGEQSRTDSNVSYFGFGYGPYYDYWIFDITYELPSWDDSSGSAGDPIPYIKHDWQIGSKLIAVPEDSWEWSDGDPILGDGQGALDIGIQHSIITHVLTWPKILNPPFANIRALANVVNSGALTWRTGTMAAETLLFRGADISEETLYGLRIYQMRYFFEEAVGRKDALTGGVAGWNHFWRDSGAEAGWYKAVNTNNVSGNTNAFATGNLNALFGI